MKLLPGDHVAQKGLTDDQYHAIAKKFMGSGAIDGEYPSYGSNRTLPFFGCHPQGNDLFHGQKHVFSGRLLTPSQILEDDNGWLTSVDGLPPAGTVCEVRFDTDSSPQWDKCDVIYLSPIGAVLRYADTGSEHIYKFADGIPSDMKFRPLKSDRDKAIEAACEVLQCKPGSLHGELAAKIVDAGWRLPGGGEVMLTPGTKVHVRLADGRVAEAEYLEPADIRFWHMLRRSDGSLLFAVRGAPLYQDGCRFICVSNLSPERLREMMR